MMEAESNGKLSVITAPEKMVNEDAKKSFWQINKEMLPLKLHFFLFIGGMAAFLPYLSAIGITRYGLTAGNLAAAFTFEQFIFLFFKPGIGYLADYFNKLRATITGLTVIQAILSLCIIVIPATNLRNLESQMTLSLEERKVCHLCNHYQEYDVMSSNLIFNEDILKQVSYCLKHSENELKRTDINCSQQSTNLTSVSINFQITSTACNVSSDLDILSTICLESSMRQFLFINFSVNGTRSTYTICSYRGREGSNSSRTEYDLNAMKKQCYPVLETEIEVLHKLLTNISSSDTVNCSNSTYDFVQQQEDQHNSELTAANFKTYQFWLFTIFLVSSCLCVSCIFTMSDTICHEISHNAGDDYGRQRTWGAVSWGFMAPLAGFLVDYTDSYFAAWCMMAVFCSFQIWNLSKMNLIKPDISQNVRKDLKIIFNSIEFVFFDIGVFMNGMFTGIIWFYMPWFITVIGGNKLLIGLAHTVQCFFGEVPFMFYSGWFIKKLGHFNVVSLAIFSHGIRFVCYSYLHNAWWILPIECLHGFTFGLFYSAMTSYGKLKTKPGMEATTQSVLCATYEALGAGVGSLIGGVCFDRYGAQRTYIYAAFCCAVATCFNMLSTFLIKCKRKEQDVSKRTTTDSERY